MKYLVLIFIFVISCQFSDEESVTNLDELPVVQPFVTLQFDHSDDIFFQHINYYTVSLPNGDFVLSERSQNYILRIDRSGNIVKKLTREGRGPGELQDAIGLNLVDNGKVVTYDQSNNKTVILGVSGDFIDEFSLFPIEQYRIRYVYPLSPGYLYLIDYWKPSALMNEEIKTDKILSIYNRADDTITIQQTYPDIEHTVFMIDGRPRGASEVPYASKFFQVLSADNERIYISWSETNEIAELNTDLDTLRTIPIPLKMEPLTKADIDSARQNYLHRDPIFWKTIEDNLPESRVAFDGLKVDHNNRFWLKLTRQSTHQEWLILNRDGDPQKLVKLPKEGILTHISEHHLGFRADDHLFELYEPIE